MARHGRIPYLTPGCAGEEAHEEVDDVVNQIEPNERMDEVVPHACTIGDKDAKVLKQDREFGDVDQGGVKSFFGVDRLNFGIFFISVALVMADPRIARAPGDLPVRAA